RRCLTICAGLQVVWSPHLMTRLEPHQVYAAGETETYPIVELKISINRYPEVLAAVMRAIHFAHHYEEPMMH
ncbi:hypothetical protein, partial [uncultured Ruegeria sp.]|uniref:hypothetical protein n=1 Tax=uncultured Ruegeria sp. TaxID=259304 RepID=UPI002622DA60